MADRIKRELDKEEFRIKKEIVPIQEDTFASSTVEETCTVYVQEDVKMENTEIKGKHLTYRCVY